MNEHLVNEISEATAAAIVAWLAANANAAVKLRISSAGGDPTAAMTIANAVLKHGKVEGIADGQASSAASVVLAACATRTAVKGASFCLHPAWASVTADAAGLRALADGLDAITAGMAEIYAKAIASPGEIQKLMASGDTWLDADGAKQLGLIQSIVEPGSANASAGSVTGTPASTTQNGTTPVVRTVQAVQTRYQPQVDHHQLASDGFAHRMGVKVAASALQNNPYAKVGADAVRLSHLEAAYRGEIKAASPLLPGTSDFPTVLKDAVNKVIGFEFMQAPEIYTSLCQPRMVRNFHPATLASLGLYPALPQIQEHEEIPMMSPDDGGETATLRTYASLFGVTRQAIVNDDLALIRDRAGRVGRAARRSLGDALVKLLTDNAALADGTALFHADHNNLGNTALASAALDAAWTALAAQQDNSGAALGLMPSYMVVPAALYGKANQVVSSEYEIIDSDRDSMQPNIARALVPLDNVLYDARFDGTSTTQWYLFAMGALVMLSLTDGHPEPMVTPMQPLLESDGYAGRVIVDGAPAVTGHWGCYRGGN